MFNDVAPRCSRDLLMQSLSEQATSLLTSLLKQSPAAAFNAETVIANMATMLELQPPHAWTKMDLLDGASQWSGAGVRAACFKL